MDEDNQFSSILNQLREILSRGFQQDFYEFALDEYGANIDLSDFTLFNTEAFRKIVAEFVSDYHGWTDLEQEPSTSQTFHDALQILTENLQEFDAEQPSTSSSIVSSQPEILQDAIVYHRIRELREAGLWESTRLPKCEDPPRKKTHWDFLLEEIVWLSGDFKFERKCKRRWSKQLASTAKIAWRRMIESKTESSATFPSVRDEKEAKRVCGSIARMVRDFWQNVDKVVDFRANEIVESRKRKALDQHLNFLVGAADKITSIIQERLADSPTDRRSSEQSSQRNDNSDFEEAQDDDDDESTLDMEEAHPQNGAHEELELDELYKEREMDIDQLLTTLPAGYLESLGYKVPDKDEQFDMKSEKVQSMDDDQTRTASGLEPLNGEFTDKPDLQNVDYTKLTSGSSEVRRQQLDIVAEAALEFQPKGFTLETTEVKTEIPFLLCGQLREYQLVGLDWLVTLYEKNLNGILADEMGLGKTIQTIALLAHLACTRAVWGPHLIVVPTSVILNWEMELKKWCPSLKILTYFGTAKERAEKRKGWSKANAFHVCITSYKLATQDIRAFKNKAWQYLILDEAQNIKNFRSQRWQMLLGLRSRRRLLLTGTPLQNSLMELWALLHFLMPSVFASHDDFKEWFHSPISGMVEGTSEVDQALVQRLHKVLRPFILRRLKSEVEKQLPTKTEEIIYCSLSKRQRYLYNEFLSKRSTIQNLQSGNMTSVLGVIMNLRKCCNHPNLFEPRSVISPYVSSAIAPTFAKAAFAIKKEMERNNFLPIGTAIASQLTWKTFTEIAIIDSGANSCGTMDQSKLPFVDGLKFVMDSKGGHFYKPESFQTVAKQDGIHSICNGGSYLHPSATDLVVCNNARKRRLPTPIEETPSDAIPLEKQESDANILDLFKSARLELERMAEKRDAQNRQLGQWLSKMKKISGRPILSRELIAFVTGMKSEENVMEAIETTPKEANDHFSTEEGNLMKRANTQIAENMQTWIESSLKRFLICVTTLLIDGHYEPPITSYSDHFENQLFHLYSSKIYSMQNALAHKAEICEKLEFPELRLIEYDCGKLQILARLLEQLYENKHRCLIFTQMARMLDILQSFLSYHNYKYFRLDGSTHIDQRQAMVERFNSDSTIFCFILSTRSGGIGVNLTGADTVIFYDSDWNPTMDAQAQDRCHRIGQTRNVTIYRLISERTIEENILNKSNQKRRLGEMAIDEGEFTPDFFKSANLRDLFSNEETIKGIIAPVKDQPQNYKEVETAMLSVEDVQDAIAAEKAGEETKADAIEFDENLTGGDPIDDRNVETPSEQYLELINSLKPVERYAVNFLANEYRPALDKEFEEAEALIKAKQSEFMQYQKEPSTEGETSSEEEDDKSLDITYEAGEANKLPFFPPSGTPFEAIPCWMPPSPPNSETDNIYCPSIDGALWYEPTPMAEEKLPPLPSLLNDVQPRIRHRQRKTLQGIHSAKSPQKRPHANVIKEGAGKVGRDGTKPRTEKKEQQQRKHSAPGNVLPPMSIPGTVLSPPNTPMASQSEMPGKHAMVETVGGALPPAVHATAKSAMTSSSLDESIESTVRKSRKQTVTHLRHISRNTGPIPQRPEERVGPEPARILIRLVCPEWRNVPAILPIPPTAISQTQSEPFDYEGPPWTATEDLQLLRALSVKHGLSTEMLAQNPGMQLNWSFVSEYVNSTGSVHYRSPRQCALRYQNHLLRCDEVAERGAGSSSKRQRTAGPAPHSLFVHTNQCTQEATNFVKKRSNLVADIGQQRRRLFEQPPQQQTPQLLCMSGKLPRPQEQRLYELGARYTNVVRPIDLLETRKRERLLMRQQPPSAVQTSAQQQQQNAEQR